jgi:ribosomal protein S18 acetylase RimI-like enzyme
MSGDDYEFKAVSAGAEAEDAFSLDDSAQRASLIGLYQESFFNSTYEEDFRFSQVQGKLDNLQQLEFEGAVAAKDDGIPVGFAWGFRLEEWMLDDQDFLEIYEFDPDPVEGDREEFKDYFDGETFYCAELGVSEDYRSQGLGTELKSEELSIVEDDESYDRALMRTNVQNPKKQKIDKPLGFEETSFEIDVEMPRADGTMEKDRRVYMERGV